MIWVVTWQLLGRAVDLVWLFLVLTLCLQGHMKRSHQVLWIGVNVWIIEKKKRTVRILWNPFPKQTWGGHLLKCLSEPNQSLVTQRDQTLGYNDLDEGDPTLTLTLQWPHKGINSRILTFLLFSWLYYLHCGDDHPSVHDKLAQRSWALVAVPAMDHEQAANVLKLSDREVCSQRRLLAFLITDR